MDCPWYLGFKATEECIKTCPITEENRDYSICPESTSEDAYIDMMDFEERRKMKYPLSSLYEEIQTQATEKMDEFIFRTIEPYCNKISEIKISKSLLKRALTEYFKNHQEEYERI